MNFLNKSTKITCIVASVMTGLLLITLIMLASLLNINNSSKALMSFIFTLSLMLILLLWQGILQIKVFADYKSQNGILCTDGILSICMSALLIISAILFGSLQAYNILNNIPIEGTDIRVFLTVFLSILTIWKIITFSLSLKHKHFNWWCELLDAILWLSLTVTCLISMFLNNLYNISWIIVGISWGLICVNIFYMLFSYIIKTPKYLETPKAIELYNQEQEEEKLKKQKSYNKSMNVTIEEKLKKLKELRDANLITKSEYETKKTNLLNSL